MTKGRKRKAASESRSVMVSTLVDIPTKADLDRIAREDDLSLSRILRQALGEYIDRRKNSQRAA